jgi:putative glutamine amidotransferase
VLRTKWLYSTFHSKRDCPKITASPPAIPLSLSTFHSDIPSMPNLASWIRECDEQPFANFLKPHPEIRLFNARRVPVDLSVMDGLLLTGGPDISPDFLRQEIPDPTVIEEPDPARDAWEFASLGAILQAGKPVLAVCKGVQLLNVALGGTLHLDIPNHNLPDMKYRNVQPLRHAAGAAHRFETVNSSHHQALDRLGEGLEVEAWCATDGIIEQVKLLDYPFALGVQYHPERDALYAPLFEDFFARLRA